MQEHRTDLKMPKQPAAAGGIGRATFRTDLQGLRALAVILVMCYHIWFSKVSGGVDIFLMLSAFFLTVSWARQISSGKVPNALRYWLKTFSRLVPLAATVIAAIVATTWALLPGTRWNEVISHSIASLTYRQNWELAGHNVDYYAFDTATASPLQHFWSLSVQGQIFIIWPLLLIFCALLWRYVLRRFSFTSVALAVFSLVFALSLSYSIALTASNQQLAYFHTGTRMWEFALGSMLALALPLLQRMNESARRIGGWVGLLTIIGCGAVLDVQAQFPGWLALVPTLGAALLIIAPGEQEKRNAAWLLGRKPLVKLGDMSYGMYLWHWPILVFFLHFSHRTEVGVLLGTLLMLVSIALSWASTRWIEAPLRSWQPRLPALPVLTAPKLGVPVSQAMVLAVGLAAVLLPVNVWQTSMENTRVQAAVQSQQDNPGAMATSDWDPQQAALTLPLSTELSEEWQNPGAACSGEFAPESEHIYFCQHGGDLERKPDLVLLGDSHVQHWSQAVDALMEETGGSWMMLHEPGCRPGSFQARQVERCADFQDAATEFTAQLAPSMVLTVASMSVNYHDEFGHTAAEQERLVSGYAQTIEPLLASGSQVIAMRDTPRHEFNVPECVDRYSPKLERCASPVTERLARANPVDEFLASMDYGNQVVSLDMTELLCPDGLCQPVIGNVVTYLDDSHLSKTFVDSAAQIFVQRFQGATGWDGPTQ